MAGQSNDPYWHGVFGGIYLNHLRGANYAALLQAEAICDELTHGGKEFCELEIVDFDRDGSVEALVSTRTQNLYFQPGYGGALIEHDYKPRHYNLLDTLARRPEAYHATMAQPGNRGLERLLHYDWYRRLSLLDHFFHPDTHLETVHNMSYGEQGDFINQPYESSTTVTDEGVVITLSRDGHVWVGPEFWPVRVSKAVSIPREGAGFSVDYTVTNLWDRPLSTWFGVEFNLNVRAGFGQERGSYYSAAGRHMEPASLVAMAHEEAIREIGVRDEALGMAVHLSWSEEAHLWRFPVETVSRCESGFERVYQCSVLVPNWRLALPRGGSWHCTVKQQVIEL